MEIMIDWNLKTICIYNHFISLKNGRQFKDRWDPLYIQGR